MLIFQMFNTKLFKYGLWPGDFKLYNQYKNCLNKYFFFNA